MDAIEVKMQSPTKKRVGGGDHSAGRRVKRQATTPTPTRLTRSMLKELNENGGPPVELDPGLEMGVRRRGPRTQPPKRAAQDEGITGSVKRTSTTHSRGAEAQAKEPEPKELQPAKAEPAEPESTGTQQKEPQTTTPQPEDQEKRFSEADIAAASRLAQAAIAAGLTGVPSETGTPVVEDPPSLVRFTKGDLEDILNEVVVDDGIRQKMEPHWLARTEFLTWWERPAADMDGIKEQVRRLALRWSKDLQARNTDDVDIPPTLESWRADLVIVGDPKGDKGDDEAENEGGKSTEDKNGDENDQGGGEGNKKEGETEGQARQEVEEQGDDKVDEMGRAIYSDEALEELAETQAFAMREMGEWRQAFDKEMAAEPEFMSRRAWTERVSEAQKEATTLEDTVRNFPVHKSAWVSKSGMLAAVDKLLLELRQFRVVIQLDREAFLVEFYQEGAELLLEKTKREDAEEELQKDTQQGEAREIEADLEAELEKELEGVLPAEAMAGIERESDAEEDIQTAKIRAEKEHTQVPVVEDHHDLNSGHGHASESEPGSTEPLPEVTNIDNDPKPTVVQPAHKPEGKSTEVPPHSDRLEEFTPTSTAPMIHVESNWKVVETKPWRAGENTIGQPTVEAEEKFEAVPTAEVEQQHQEGEVAGAGERMNSRETTSGIADKRGSQSPSRQGLGRQEGESEVTNPDATAAVEEEEKPSQEVRLDTAAALFNPAGVEEVNNEGEHTAGQNLTSSGLTGLSPETNPEITTGAVEDTADSSSIASYISSLPEDPGSPTAGRSEIAEEVEVGDVVDTAPDIPEAISVPEDTSLPQEMSSSMVVVTTETTEEVSGRMEEPVEDISPGSHIARMLEEASMPRDIGASIISVPPSSVAKTGGNPEETANRTPTTDLPQDTSLATPGIPSGSDMGVGGQVEQTVGDGAPATSDAAAVPQGSSIGGDIDSPPAMSAGENPIVVPTVRYIKPQWEDTGSLFSPEEPTCDYSANEAEDDDDEDGEIGSADDRETDDVDP